MPFRKKLLGLFIAIAFQPALLAKDATLEEIASAFTERQNGLPAFAGKRGEKPLFLRTPPLFQMPKKCILKKTILSKINSKSFLILAPNDVAGMPFESYSIRTSSRSTRKFYTTSSTESLNRRITREPNSKKKGSTVTSTKPTLFCEARIEQSGVTFPLDRTTLVSTGEIGKGDIACIEIRDGNNSTSSLTLYFIDLDNFSNERKISVRSIG